MGTLTAGSGYFTGPSSFYSQVWCELALTSLRVCYKTSRGIPRRSLPSASPWLVDVTRCWLVQVSQHFAAFTVFPKLCVLRVFLWYLWFAGVKGLLVYIRLHVLRVSGKLVFGGGYGKVPSCVLEVVDAACVVGWGVTFGLLL